MASKARASTKSAKKDEIIPFVTPWFTARWPKISKPDTEGQKADGKFKTDGILDEGDVDAVRETLMDAAKKFHPGVAEEDLYIPLREFFNGRKDEEKTSAGWGITLKSKFRPAVFDSKKKKLPEGVEVGPGSVIRVAAGIRGFERPVEETIVENGKKTKVKSTQYGVTLYLNDVQVKSLVAGSGGGTGAAFDEVEDGFEYEAGDAGSEQFADSPTDL